ncbi:molybdenum cofactor biosynthesis protein MoaE [Pandoraea sputorum]|uniref:Molybdopterin synthase catalytic subunit n=1 Tax=Pandoraea sputorum TaxID=93222 RepID=A0A5E5ATF2_9BURK|nr:molybdenum cofactor biosynthesis protein MoaE [Pandoraea sputorum]VVE76989.1 molybdenum cofactor biosynthesis protein MoaE [Pandoraea sputorum]
MTASFSYKQALPSTPDASSGISSGVEVRLQTQAIAIECELAPIMRNPRTGAIVNFLGVVRQAGEIDDVMALEIEHYPGMTERTLWGIVEEAQARWPLDTVKIVHRIDRVPLGEAVVIVIVAAQHRSSAFSACEFLMDFLKHNAPFWKKEVRRDGATEWVVPHPKNEHATIRWG